MPKGWQGCTYQVIYFKFKNTLRGVFLF